MKLRASSVVLLSLAILLTTFPASAEDGMAQGVTVHGHWKIEVFEPDGKLVGTFEFKNALVNNGGFIQYLTGGQTQGLWNIELEDLAAPGGAVVGPCEVSGTGSGCFIAEPAEIAGPSPDIFKTLQITTPAGQSVFVLSGTATAALAGNIEVVRTGSSYCGSTIDAASCTQTRFSTEWFAFTETALAVPVPVLAGQLIQVTVTISFSS